MKTFAISIVIGTITFAALAGLFMWAKHIENEKEQSAHIAKALEIADELNAAKQEAKIETAILERRVIKQMNHRQVLAARGEPEEILTGNQLNENLRAKGYTEMWVWAQYGAYGVVFDSYGRVVYSTDDK